MVDPSSCIRCRRPVPPVESDEFVQWEANSDDGGESMICPGCLTGEEVRWTARTWRQPLARWRGRRRSPDGPQATGQVVRERSDGGCKLTGRGESVIPH